MIDNKEYAAAVRAVTAEMFVARGDGHIGGSFSMADAVAVIFNKYLRKEPHDWFVLSKGHAGPAYYAALYLTHKIPEESLGTLNANGTILPSHPDRNLTPGVDCSTGSLGQGISQATGLAYANKLKKTGAWVYCIIGDGELNEGETYEALEFASNKHLGNLIIFLDNNKKQVDGLIKDVSCDYDYPEFFKGLRLPMVSIDGNDTDQIDKAIDEIQKSGSDECHVILMDTVKGKGISYFENLPNCHHMTFNENELNVLKDFISANKGAIQDVLENTK